jgi:predicted nucleic acid-binding Zn ribbon protein
MNRLTPGTNLENTMICYNRFCLKKFTKTQSDQIFCSEECELGTKERRRRAKIHICQNCSDKVSRKDILTGWPSLYCSERCEKEFLQN